MATSSITEKIRVNNPKLVEDYVAALESSDSEKGSVDQKNNSNITIHTTDNVDEIESLMLKGIKKCKKK